MRTDRIASRVESPPAGASSSRPDARLRRNAEMGLTNAPAGADHLVAVLPLRCDDCFDGTCEVDACDAWEAPHTGALPVGRQGHLVSSAFDHSIQNGDVRTHNVGLVELQWSATAVAFPP